MLVVGAGTCINPLSTELNPNWNSQLTEFFCGVFKFCAWYSKNLNISRSGINFWNKKHFVGKETDIAQKALKCSNSTVCTEDGRIDALQVGLCVVIFKTVSINTKRHVTLHTSENHSSPHAPLWTHATSAFRATAARPMLIVTCVQPFGVIRWWGWSPYRHGWSWIMPRPCQHLSDKSETKISVWDFLPTAWR